MRAIRAREPLAPPDKSGLTFYAPLDLRPVEHPASHRGRPRGARYSLPLAPAQREVAIQCLPDKIADTDSNQRAQPQPESIAAVTSVPSLPAHPPVPSC